jgi:adenylate kinase family enzyme
VSLDAHYWQPGWETLPREVWHWEHDRLLKPERWVIDGNYVSTLDNRLARADTVIFLDFPRWRCLLGIAKRTSLWWGRTRPEMAPGCPERIDIHFLRYVWNFRNNHYRQIVDLLEHHPNLRVQTVRNRRERTALLAAL